MKSDVEILDSIISCCENIEQYLSGIESFDTFVKDKKTVEACVFNLLQIGELSNKFSNNFCSENNEIKYNQIKGLRNRIMHDYIGINLKIVWETLSIDIPNLKIELLVIKANSKK